MNFESVWLYVWKRYVWIDVTAIYIIYTDIKLLKLACKWCLRGYHIHFSLKEEWWWSKIWSIKKEYIDYFQSVN